MPSFKSPTLKSLSVDSNKLVSLFANEHDSLRSLEISGSKDLCIEGLKFCPALENLDLLDMRGKIDITHISQIKSLKRLSLDGEKLEVESLEPISRMPNLSWVFLGNTKVKDGNLRVLGNLPQLKKIGFNDKKGNDITYADFLTSFQCERI